MKKGKHSGCREKIDQKPMDERLKDFEKDDVDKYRKQDTGRHVLIPHLSENQFVEDDHSGLEGGSQIDPGFYPGKVKKVLK